MTWDAGVANLRRNLIVSAIAMLVVGVLRPAFHGVVNQTFGPEVNGRAAAAISLFFLAALPAAAAWPTVVVRQVSRALGAEDHELARGRAALGFKWMVLLGSLGAAGAMIYGHFRLSPPLPGPKLLIVAVATLGYIGWRFGRMLLLVVGKVQRSLLGDIAGAVALAIALGVCLWLDYEPFVIPFVAFYIGYNLFVFRPMWNHLSRGRLEEGDRMEFFRYGALWSVGTATSLATREATLLVLDDRVSSALVGDAAVALSLLMLLAYAPRLVEVPLTHELSKLGGGSKIDDQRNLAQLGLHWLMVLTVSLAVVVALLSPMILKAVGGVENAEVVTVFVVVLFAFGAEMMVSPCTNLIAAEAPPTALAYPGVLSLAAAAAVWSTPWAHDLLGICAGLAASYAVKAIWIAAYAKSRFGVQLLVRPLAKLALVTAAIGAGWIAHNTSLPLPAIAALFSLVSVALFQQELRAVLGALVNR